MTTRIVKVWNLLHYLVRIIRVTKFNQVSKTKSKITYLENQGQNVKLWAQFIFLLFSQLHSILLLSLLVFVINSLHPCPTPPTLPFSATVNIPCKWSQLRPADHTVTFVFILTVTYMFLICQFLPCIPIWSITDINLATKEGLAFNNMNINSRETFNF